jgi:hypothetical protein
MQTGSSRSIPGPAGATESLLPLEAWREVAAANSVLGTLEADVEAVLLRDREARRARLLSGADRLSAMRSRARAAHWKGFEGGVDALARDRPRSSRTRGVERSDVDGERRSDASSRSASPRSGPSRTRRCPRCCSRSTSRSRAGTPVHSLALRAQVRIEPNRREYAAREREKLRELFGEPARWGETLRRSCSGAHLSAVWPGFTGRARFDLPMPVTYDFEVAAAKYPARARGGGVPLRLLFSGTLFEAGRTGSRSASCRGISRRPASCRSRCGAS